MTYDGRIIVSDSHNHRVVLVNKKEIEIGNAPDDKDYLNQEF